MIKQRFRCITFAAAMMVSALAYVATPTAAMVGSVGVVVAAATMSQDVEANTWPAPVIARTQTTVSGGQDIAAIAASNGYYNTYELTGTCIAGTVWTFWTVDYVLVPNPPIRGPARGSLRYWRQNC